MLGWRGTNLYEDNSRHLIGGGSPLYAKNEIMKNYEVTSEKNFKNAPRGSVSGETLWGGDTDATKKNDACPALAKFLK